MQKHLLSALEDASTVGVLSTMWLNSLYKNGYTHPDTTLLAHLFCAILDGAKTGTTIIKQKYQQLKKAHAGRGAAWNEPRNAPAQNEPNPKRHPTLGKFVMDILQEEIKEKCSHQLVLVKERLQVRPWVDQDLTAPWKKAEAQAKLLASHWNLPGKPPPSFDLEHQLKLIADHVKKVHGKSKEMIGSGGDFSRKSIVERQDTLRQISLLFAEGPSSDQIPLIWGEQLKRLKASFAYLYDSQMAKGGWSRFPFEVAMGELCAVKAGAQGQSKTVSSDIYNGLRMDKGALKPIT